MLVRLCVHIIVDNIMMRVFKSTVLNCKYFGGFSMNLFQTRIYCTKFCVLRFSYLSSGGHDENESQILLQNQGCQCFCVHIIVDNIMMRVFKSTILNYKYFGGFGMDLFQTWIFCTKFCVLPFSHLNSTSSSTLVVPELYERECSACAEPVVQVCAVNQPCVYRLCKKLQEKFALYAWVTSLFTKDS